MAEVYKILEVLDPLAKLKENLMDLQKFHQLMQSVNFKQRQLLLHIAQHLINEDTSPLYNRFFNNDGHFNAHLALAPTAKAAKAINGITIDTALNVWKKLSENWYYNQQFFKHVKAVIIDEMNMISLDLLNQINGRLRQVTLNYDKDFGGLDIILIGDLRQLKPIREPPIYKQSEKSLKSRQDMIWQKFHYYELTQVMRQSDEIFSGILTKIGNGDVLQDNERKLIESRFFTKQDADRLCPRGIRIVQHKIEAGRENDRLLQQLQDTVISPTVDIVHANDEVQENQIRQQLPRMFLYQTEWLPHSIMLSVNKPYVITKTIDATDGLVSGTVGTIVLLQQNNNHQIKRVWMMFSDDKVGCKLRQKAADYSAQYGIDQRAVPISRLSACIKIKDINNARITRCHFPLQAFSSIFIYDSQGETFDEVVYYHHKSHSLSKVYLALSLVKNIKGLFIVEENNDLHFEHCRVKTNDLLKKEFERLSSKML